MRKSIELSVIGSYSAWLDGLESSLKSWIVTTYSDSVFFRVPLESLSDARNLYASATEARLAVEQTSQLIQDPEDITEDRVYLLFAPIDAKAQLDKEQILQTAACGLCPGETLRWIRGAEPPSLKLSPRPKWPLFRPKSCYGTLIARDFAEELQGLNLLQGAELTPLRTGQQSIEYCLFGSTVAIELARDPAATVCSDCERVSGGSLRFYPQFEKPAMLADVYFSPRYGEHLPIVSGRLARHLQKHLVGKSKPDFWLAGWTPDHDEDARVPSLSI